MTVITDSERFNSMRFNSLHFSAVDRSASDVAPPLIAPQATLPPTIVPIRTAGTQAPVFCIHPIDGLAGRYCALAEHIGADHPVYGVQIAGAGERSASITALAARYADDILAVRTAGPIHLLGLSFGGVLAHAVAVELQNRGVTVRSLTLLASEPVRPGTHTDQQHDLLAGMSDDVDRSRAEELLAVAAHNDNLAKSHFPGIYVGAALIVSTTDSDAGSAWHTFVSGTVTKYEIPDAAAYPIIGRLINRHL